MARRVYFAFHYQNDIWRVNQVRNSWLTHPGREDAGFYDASLWEKAKKTSDLAIQRMIDNGLKGTSVTVFLLGSETANRKWVKYELTKSSEIGNGMLAIRIHGLKDRWGSTSTRGDNIFEKFHITKSNGTQQQLDSIYPIYDWFLDSGYSNLGDWVEKAARQAGR